MIHMNSTDPQEPDESAAGPEVGRPCVTALSDGDRQFLLQLAREAIHAASIGAVPPHPVEGSSSVLEPRACFVTIHKHGELRGCIGQVTATRPLKEAVVHSAYGAAIRDPRFDAVQPSEVRELDVEVSVLSPPVHVDAHSADDLLRQVEPFKHGVLLQYAGNTSTFLPQVWHTLPDKVAFMERLARKAGLSRDVWREPTAQVSVYEVDSFEDKAALE